MTPTSRWAVLAVLFAVRAAMAFQFQSVAALAPLLGRDYGFSLIDVGILIGLFFAPGIALAYPGGAIGRRFGDKRTVLAGLAIMIAGGCLMSASAVWSAQVAGRLLVGVGGVLLNVLLTKMLTDWFAGREIATAMAIFVNSWPLGVAAALVALPPLGASYGVPAAYLVATALMAASLVLLAATYAPPPGTAAAAGQGGSLDRPALLAICAAGLIWALFNIGFAMVFSFGPSMLAERGWSPAQAGSATSIVLWLATLSVPLGGIIADRTGRGQLVLVLGCIGFAGLMLLASRSSATVPLFVVLGAVCGIPAGAIMSLPARVLTPATRAVGMGIFYTIFNAGMMLGPAAAARFAAWFGSAAAAFDFGALVLVLCPLVLWVFNATSAGVPRAAPAS